MNFALSGIKRTPLPWKIRPRNPIEYSILRLRGGRGNSKHSPWKLTRRFVLRSNPVDFQTIPPLYFLFVLPFLKLVHRLDVSHSRISGWRLRLGRVIRPTSIILAIFVGFQRSKMNRNTQELRKKGDTGRESSIRIRSFCQPVKYDYTRALLYWYSSMFHGMPAWHSTRAGRSRLLPRAKWLDRCNAFRVPRPLFSLASVLRASFQMRGKCSGVT